MALDCSEVIQDRLWVGKQIREEDVSHLCHLGITIVISLQTDYDVQSFGISLSRLAKLLSDSGITLVRIATQDFNRESLANNLGRAVSELESALLQPEAKVYLHCTAGVNRAPTVAAAYLIRSQHISARAAYEYISARRHCNPDFALLDQYESSLNSSR